MGGTDSTKDPYNVNGFAKKIGDSLETSFGNGPAVFDQSLYAGMGDTSKTALSDLNQAAHAGGYGFDDAIGYNTNLLQNGGLTGGMRDARHDVLGVGNNYNTIADSLRNPSAAQTGWGGISGQYGDIASGLTGSSAAQTGLGSISDRYGSIADSLRGASDNQHGQGGIASQFGTIASGLQNPSAAQTGYTGLYNQAGDKSLTEKTLMGVAKGDYLSGSDPYFEQNLQKSLGDASLGVNAAIGANGRYGSSVQADTLGSTLGNISSQARSANYQSEIARQQQALSAIEGQRQEGFTNQFNSLGASDQARLAQLAAREGALTSRSTALNAQDAARLNQIGAREGALQGQSSNLTAADAARQAQIGLREGALTGQGNALSQSDAARLAQVGARESALQGQQGAAQTAFTMGQQGVTNANAAGQAAAGLYNNSLLPAQTALQVGQMRDANKQAALSGENDLFRRQHDAKRDWAGSYLSMAMPGGYQQQPAEVPWWQQALGWLGSNAGKAAQAYGGG